MSRVLPAWPGARPQASARMPPTFLLHHRHAPEECRFAFAAWHGTDSPLRHGGALCSCRAGDHALWWLVAAQDAAAALAQLPEFVQLRTTAIHVDEVPIP